MPQLLLLRHAEADWPEGVDDIARPLTARGLEDAREMGTYLASHDLVPEGALVSTSRRTRQTWERVSAGSDVVPETTFADELYNASARRLLQVIREHGGNARRLLVVAHSPGIPDVVAILAAHRDRVPLSYPTTTLTVLDLPTDGWSGIEAGTASVERVVVRSSG